MKQKKREKVINAVTIMHVKKRSQNVVTKTVFTLNVDYDRLGPVVRKPINLIQD